MEYKPVAWFCEDESTLSFAEMKGCNCIPLYAHPLMPDTEELETLRKENRGLKAAMAAQGIAKSFEKMSREQFIQEAVNRFLGWKLPKDFHPDCGITFKAPEKHHDSLYEDWPVGTNLLTAEQAKIMFEHCIQERKVIMPQVEEQLARHRAVIEIAIEALKRHTELIHAQSRQQMRLSPPFATY